MIEGYFNMVIEYKKEYGEKTVVLIQVGAFFEVYGNEKYPEIKEIAERCELQIGAKGQYLMIGFRDFMLEKYLKKLQQQLYTVVVIIQDEQRSGTTRSVLGIYSPGTYFLESANAVVSNNTMCIWLYKSFSLMTKKEMIYIGMSVINIYTGKVSVYQTSEILVYMPTTFDEIERWVSIYNPNEIIIISLMSDAEIKKIIQMTNIKSKKIHIKNKEDDDKIRNCEKQVYQKAVLEMYYSCPVYQDLLEYPVALQSLCYLLDFMNTHNTSFTKNIDIPCIENNENRVQLTNYCLKQLNILDTEQSQMESGDLTSVSKMITSKCKTVIGKRKMEYLLLHPITDYDKLQYDYDVIEKVMEYGNYEIVSEELKKCKDLDKLIRKLVMNKMTTKEIYYIYDSFALCGVINKYCSGIFDLNSVLIHGFVGWFNERFEESGLGLILKAFDERTRLLHEYEKEYCDLLKYIETEMGKFEIMLKGIEKKKKSAEEKDYFRLDKETFCILSTERRCQLVKSGGGGLSVHKVNSTESKIESKLIKEKGIRLMEIRDMKKKIIDEVIKEYLEIIKEEYLEAIHYVCEYLTNIDVYYTKELIARIYGYCKPLLVKSSNSFIKCKDLRHPLIENINQSEVYVANDVELSGTGILLYGTNAVGKTSFIKSIGIAVILAQSGFYVPASEFELSPYRAIMTRIIGNDNLFKGLSTFAVEMSELRTILRMADGNSLILGDELCSGTEICSATSIFVSGIQELTEKKSSFIFATHLHEIVMYDEIISLCGGGLLEIKHMAVVYDKEKDELVYDRKIKEGSGSKMYGLEVCKAMHLPDKFLENANKIRLKYHTDGENVGILDLKPSQYNENLLKGLLCEKCGKKRGEEVHHLIPQKEANKDGLIKKKGVVMNKNHLSNLMNICSECHKMEHKKK
jgi:DNA mismatch repair protein MutS